MSHDECNIVAQFRRASLASRLETGRRSELVLNRRTWSWVDAISPRLCPSPHSPLGSCAAELGVACDTPPHRRLGTLNVVRIAGSSVRPRVTRWVVAPEALSTAVRPSASGFSSAPLSSFTVLSKNARNPAETLVRDLQRAWRVENFVRRRERGPSGMPTPELTRENTELAAERGSPQSVRVRPEMPPQKPRRRA